jgi:hypothetical protein
MSLLRSGSRPAAGREHLCHGLAGASDSLRRCFNDIHADARTRCALAGDGLSIAPHRLGANQQALLAVATDLVVSGRPSGANHKPAQRMVQIRLGSTF